MKKYNTILIALFTVTFFTAIASFITDDIFWIVSSLVTAISALVFLFFGEIWCIGNPKNKVNIEYPLGLRIASGERLLLKNDGSIYLNGKKTEDPQAVYEFLRKFAESYNNYNQWIN